MLDPGLTRHPPGFVFIGNYEYRCSAGYGKDRRVIAAGNYEIGLRDDAPMLSAI
jgi:hypothetical protein